MTGLELIAALGIAAFGAFTGWLLNEINEKRHDGQSKWDLLRDIAAKVKRISPHFDDPEPGQPNVSLPARMERNEDHVADLRADFAGLNEYVRGHVANEEKTTEQIMSLIQGIASSVGVTS